MKDRLLGFLLFLPVPLVLWLFTRAPLGVPLSLGLGVVVMGTHRLYSRPFALGRSNRRCLWCGRPAPAGIELTLEEPVGRTVWKSCREGHRESLVRTFAWAHWLRWPLRLGILGGLVFLFLSSIAALLTPAWPVSFPDASAAFRLSVALVVTPLGWLSPLAPRNAVDHSRVPFPVHIQGLIGTRLMLWLFRIVGIIWLVAAIWHFSRPG